MINIMKKICKYTCIVMAISFVCALVTAPFAIKGLMNDIQSASEKVSQNIVKKEALETTTKAVISSNVYCDIEFRQSTNGKFYVELFNGGNKSIGGFDITTELTEENGVAYFTISRDYTKPENILERMNIYKEFIRNFVYYPDMIIYIPENIEVDVKGEYISEGRLIGSDVMFSNRDALIEKVKAEYNYDMGVIVDEIRDELIDRDREIYNNMTELENKINNSIPSAVETY